MLLFLNKLICSIYSIEQLNQMLSGLGLNLPEIKATEVLKKISKINKKGKLDNLNLLNLTIKDYISKDISRKTSTLIKELFKNFLKMKKIRIFLISYLMN